MRQSLRIITVLMFLYFGQVHPVDIALLKLEMGGLHDSTNLFSPLVVICPSIGLDHQGRSWAILMLKLLQKRLGFKNGASFIYATDRTDVRDVFKQKANEEGSKT